MVGGARVNVNGSQATGFGDKVSRVNNGFGQPSNMVGGARVNVNGSQATGFGEGASRGNGNGSQVTGFGEAASRVNNGSGEPSTMFGGAQVNGNGSHATVVGGSANRVNDPDSQAAVFRGPRENDTSLAANGTQRYSSGHATSYNNNNSAVVEPFDLRQKLTNRNSGSSNPTYNPHSGHDDRWEDSRATGEEASSFDVPVRDVAASSFSSYSYIDRQTAHVARGRGMGRIRGRNVFPDVPAGGKYSADESPGENVFRSDQYRQRRFSNCSSGSPVVCVDDDSVLSLMGLSLTHDVNNVNNDNVNNDHVTSAQRPDTEHSLMVTTNGEGRTVNNYPRPVRNDVHHVGNESEFCLLQSLRYRPIQRQCVLRQCTAH